MRRFEAELLREAWTDLVDSLAVTGRAKSQQTARSREIHQVHSIAADGFHDRREQRRRVELRLRQVSQIPVRAVCASLRARDPNRSRRSSPGVARATRASSATVASEADALIGFIVRVILPLIKATLYERRGLLKPPAHPCRVSRYTIHDPMRLERVIAFQSLPDPTTFWP